MNPEKIVPAQSPRARHPFYWLATPLQKWLLAGSLLLALVLMVAIHLTNAPLQNPTAPLGMVSFQLAGSLAAAETILTAWGAEGQRWARINLWFDYPYLLAYAVSLALGCVVLARQFPAHSWFARLGSGLAWGVVAAALLDAFENVMLFILLSGDLREIWAMLAYWCAVPKFGLVLAALLYLAAGGLALLLRAGQGKPG